MPVASAVRRNLGILVKPTMNWPVYRPTAPKSADPAAFVDGANGDNARWSEDASVTIERGPFERIVAGARVLRDPTKLPLTEGEYVYLGDAEPLSTETVTLIMDEATPPWLAGHLQTILADTFAYFTDPGCACVLMHGAAPLVAGTGGLM